MSHRAPNTCQNCIHIRLDRETCEFSGIVRDKYSCRHNTLIAGRTVPVKRMGYCAAHLRKPEDD